MRARFWLLVSSFLVLALVASPIPGSVLAPVAAAAESGSDLSVPYGSPGWRYKVVGHGGDPGFEGASVDDSAWSVGSAPFGNVGCSGTPAPVTAWPLSTDLLVRRTLDLNPSTVTADLALRVAIDNDVDVFFNGVLIASNDFEGCGREKATFAIPRSLVVDGANVLAVRAIDRGGINYLDLDLKVEGGADPEEPPVTPHDPVADAGGDQAATEGSVVTLDGSGSQASLKPVLSASEKRDTLPGGTSIGVKVTGLAPDAPEGRLTLQGSADVGQGPAATNTSVAYVVDISGSANDIVNCGGDANGDGRANTVLDCEIAAVIALHQQLVASGTVDKVGLIPFSSAATARDLDPTSAVATLIAPSADKDGNGVLDLVQVVKTLRVSGGTNFAAPTRAACQLLATTGSTNLVTAFMSDGEGTSGDLRTIVPCTPPVTFQAFAVGTGSSCTAGPVSRQLLTLATLSGGACRNVPNVEDLPNILPEVISSRITGVSYTLDDDDPVDVSAQLDLPKDGPVEVPLALDLPSALGVGTHRVCVSVTGTDSGGESAVVTCSDLVMTTGELSYRWRTVSADGPPVLLTASTSKQPSFVATDDGTYVFELEVTDGLGGTATDRVTVTVGNAAPAMTADPGNAYAGGVTQVNGTFTDSGWVDTHTATLDWGDGTTQQVPVSVQGSGWGTFFGSHVYATAGTYQLTIVLRDDDGGEATKTIGQLQVQTPVAVWANSASLTRSLNWGGAEGNIEGRVHTNGLLRFVGARKTVLGGTTFAGALSADTTRNSFVPEPAHAAVQGFPIRFAVADYRPGGRVAEEIGAAYHDMSAACASGTWHEVQSVLADGVYYAPCPVQLNGSDIGGRITLVSEGSIKISGSRPAFEPYLDGLLLLSGSDGAKAIDVATSTSKFLGVIFAGTGEISVSGASNRFFCGVLGDRVDITGGDTDIRGAVCGRPDSTVSGPVLVPDLAAQLAVDKDQVLPSQTLGYDLTVTNKGATLVAPALIGLENVDTVTETLTGYDFGLERLDVATGKWLNLASRGDDGFRVDLRPNAFPGVTYPTGGGLAGTTVPPRGWATWGLQAVLELDPAEVTDLLDPGVTAGIRTRADFTLIPSGAQARRLFTYGDNFIEALRALSSDVKDANATLLLPSGDAEAIGPDADSGLAGIAPGESVTLQRTWDVPVAAPRGAGESDAGYLARLKLLDGSALTGGLFVLATGGVGRLVAPLTTATSHRTLPVVDITATGPTVVTAGTSAHYDLGLSNVGSSPAGDLAVKATATGTALPVTGAPTALAAGELTTAGTTYLANATPAGGTVPLRGTAAWKDSAGNSYGVTGSTVAITEQTPAKLQASLADMLVTDAGADGATSPGDTVRYTAIVRNTGDATLTGVTAEVRLDENTAFVPGSGVVQNGTVSHADGVVAVTLPDVLGNTARTVTFDVKVADPFPAGLNQISTQGTVKATGQADVLSDDLTLPGPADPTTTPVIRSFAALSALLSGRLAVDGDGNGFVSAGDTLAYRLEVNSVGTQIVTGISLDAPTPQGTTLVAGSATTTQGTVTPGDHLSVDLGTMGPLSQHVVEFRLKVDQPLSAGVSAISVQADLHADQIGSQPSDDPHTAELEDPTVLPVGTTGGGGGPGGGQDGNGPVIGDLGPADGTIATEPVHITATLTPPDGQTLDAWVVDYRRADDTTVSVLETGTGSAVDAVFDPTVLPNGTYVVTVRGTTTIGGLATREITVVVDGQMKLGRYTTTITDMTVGVAGLPIQIGRTYDSFDKIKGDFGVGWSLDVADFQISSNGPLGDGGWTMQGCGTGLIFVPLCFTSDRPHFVTVTWPDGHNEFFDLTPAQGSTFFSGLTTAQFTARPGSTSKLAAPDNSLFWSNGNLTGGLFGTDGIYNPTRFVLTDKYGTKHTLEVGDGLKKIEDRVGTVTTFTRDGITSSRGPSVTFTRNSDGVITKVTGPDGKTIGYGYENDDLTEVTNQRGHTTTYSYFAGHYLKDVTGPDSKIMATFEYEDGRIVAVIDGEGNRTEVSAQVGARVEKITDPGGARVTFQTYNDKGLLVELNEVYDGQSHITSYGYDAKNNLTLRKDPLGHEWLATYENGHLTHLKLPSGGETVIKYNDLGLPLTWRDAENHVTTYGWNPDGTLDFVRDARGFEERYTYTGGLRTGKVDREGHSWAWTYTPEGRLETAKDPMGHITRYEYDAVGRQKLVVDPLGNRTETVYDEVGNTRFVKDPDGRVNESVYNQLNQLARTIDPAGAIVDYKYDDAGRTETVDNHVDAISVYGYDGMGRRTSVKVGSRPAAITVYDGAGNVVESRDEIGRTTKYTYYSDGRLKTTENPAGGVTAYTYFPDGQTHTETDPLGNVTRYSYTQTGRVETITDPRGHTVRTEYDEAGNPRFTHYPDGTQTEQQYDKLGRLKVQIDQQGDQTRYEYGPVGHQIAGIDPENRRVETGYDPAGRATSTKHADGAVTERTYTPGALLKSETTPQGVTTSYGYDPAGRLATTSNELGHVWSTSYDDLGRVLTQRDPRQQGSGPATTTNDYDEFGNLASTTDAAGNRVEFGYDHADQRTSIKDPRGKAWTIGYTALGDVEKEVDPLLRHRIHTYDKAGLRRTMTDARGVKVQYDYDKSLNLTLIENLTGTGAVEYGYDVIGRRDSMTDATGQTTWEYFPDGAVKQVAAPAGTVSYTYDASGLRKTMTQPAGTVTYGYDTAGRLDNVTDWADRVIDADYDTDGRIKTVSRPNGIQSTWTYDDASRLKSVTHRRGDAIVDSATYTLDADGNRTSLTTPTGTESYTINPIDQLTAVTYPGGSTTTYTYDEAGNRATAKTGSNPADVYTYDDASQLTSINGNSVLHDHAGNLTKAEGTEYDWDWLGRMIQVTGSAVPGGSAGYNYDGDGVRVDQTVAAGAESLLYDRAGNGGLPVLIADADEQFIHLGGSPAEVIGAGVDYPLADALGSIRTVSEADGTVGGSTAYDVFGGVRSANGQQTPFGFTGAPQAGQLVHLNARDLNAQLGRFLAVDPVRPGAPGAVGWNQYTYVGNNTTTMTDPSGMVSALESGVLTHRQVVAFAVGAAALGYALSLQLSQTCLVQGTCTLDPPWGNNGSNSGNSNGGGSSVAQLADDIFSFTRVKGVTQAVAQAAAAACAGSAAVASVFGDANAACSGPDVRIFFVGQLDLPDHFGHIAKAIAGNPTWVKLNKGSGSASRGWLDAQPTCVQARAQGEACDEYPFASTVQGGGPGAHPELFGSPQSEVFSLHGVDRQESSRQGGKLGAMYRSSRCGMTQGTPFLVITVPRPSPTFHFCKQ